jgi:excisionase family DNA binding protein
MNDVLFEEQILTVPQVAKFLQISRSKAYYMVTRKQIPYIRLGRNVRVRKSDLLKWLELQTEKVV